MGRNQEATHTEGLDVEATERGSIRDVSSRIGKISRAQAGQKYLGRN